MGSVCAWEVCALVRACAHVTCAHMRGVWVPVSVLPLLSLLLCEELIKLLLAVEVTSRSPVPACLVL